MLNFFFSIFWNAATRCAIQKQWLYKTLPQENVGHQSSPGGIRGLVRKISSSLFFLFNHNNYFVGSSCVYVFVYVCGASEKQIICVIRAVFSHFMLNSSIAYISLFFFHISFFFSSLRLFCYFFFFFFTAPLYCPFLFFFLVVYSQFLFNSE